MATIANDPLKERLLGKGLWADFVRMRHDVCESEGLSSAKAAAKVLEQIDPDAIALLNGRGRPMKNGKKSLELKMRNCANKQSDATTVADTRRANRDAKVVAKVDSAKSDDCEYEITKETFAGKSCSNIASILWAYSKHRVKDISPADAPSELAWNLLLDMRQSPSFKADMMGKMAVQWAKQSDRSEGADWEGKSQYDDLEAISIANGGVV